VSSGNATAACLDRGDHRGAWIELARLVGAAPSTADCHVAARAMERLDAVAAGVTPVRVAILASVTAEPIAPMLIARGVRSHLALRTYVAPFDQWTQQALDPASELFQFDPDVVVLMLGLDEVAPALGREFLDGDAAAHAAAIDRTGDRIDAALRGIRSRTRARILLHAMVPPAAPALGMIDAQSGDGQRPAVRALNVRLAAACAETADAFLVDVERLVTRLGVSRWHDARMAALARLPYTPVALHALAEEYLRFIRAFTGRVRKVLITDLDDTLWGGIVGEAGPSQVRLTGAGGAAYLDLQRILLDLQRRGVLLAINSKNNEADAFAVLDERADMLLRREHFAAMRVNWDDKADNVIAIAAELGLGLDSVVYIDDSAAECARVQAACPDVLVVHLGVDLDGRADAIRDLGVFDRLSISEDDRRRSARYGAEHARGELRASAQTLEQFYASLEMEMAVERVSPATLGRAADLTQRTNQFTIATRRFTPDALAAHLDDAQRAGFVFRLADRFGDHGWIGLAMAEQQGERAVITDFMLSCRVLKRTVETAMLAAIGDWARERGASVLAGSFIPTSRNAPAATLFADHGFAPLGAASGDGAHRFERRLEPPLAPPAWITVRCTAAVSS
jgi:FkbH-like protein